MFIKKLLDIPVQSHVWAILLFGERVPSHLYSVLLLFFFLFFGFCFSFFFCFHVLSLIHTIRSILITDIFKILNLFKMLYYYICRTFYVDIYMVGEKGAVKKEESASNFSGWLQTH